jgi:hypothetical protein
MRQLRISLAVLALTFAIGLGGPVAQAQSATSFTLQPGGKATITFEAFCTEFGKLFPTAIQSPDGTVAPDEVRSALVYAQNKGLTADVQQALQVQYAIWQLLGTTNSPKGDALAQDVIGQASTPVADPSGTSILDAAKSGQITMTLDLWQPIGQKVQITTTASDNFYGRGQLTVENSSQQALTLFMPVGTIFPPSLNAQRMAAIQTDLKVTNPNLPATGSDETLPWAIPTLAGLLLLSGWQLLRAGRRA